jgi:hypothetical protein
MKSHVDDRFRRLFAALPERARRQARAAYRLFRENSRHKSLQFKLVNAKEKLYSVRIGRSYRALGFMDDDGEMVWFWIGSHAEYDKLIAHF